jgi:N-acetylglucosaminyldiphosphoundecaprenol N-acetyl-beta-D-mannosaminyltransferase
VTTHFGVRPYPHASTTTPPASQPDPASDHSRIDIVGVSVDPLTTDEVVETVVHWTEMDGVHVAVGINANTCNLAAADADLSSALESADLAYADGQSIVWAARLLGRVIPERVATTDLIQPLASACAERGKKMFFFGGTPGVAAAAAEKLTSTRPTLAIETENGFISEAEMPALIARINASHSDVLLVGQGDPIQHRWISEHRDELTVHAVLTCGGLFDWISQSKRRAPGWMMSAGLEWLWRLMIEPRRLAKRYLLGNPAFLARLGRSMVIRRVRHA